MFSQSRIGYISISGMKIFKKNIWILIILIFINCIFLSCAPFTILPQNVKEHSQIIGVYSNDCDSTNSNMQKKLWEFIDTAYHNPEDSLFLKFGITKNNKLKAQLQRGNKVLFAKIIQGKFKKDQCYYFPRQFSFFPILPILWWYKNKQDRLFYINETLVVEHIFSTGGTIIFMAGGYDENYKWYYHRIAQ